ncbi:MAG: hypothetical protein H8E90_06225 [Anaerolineales bacterium]|nr:hypothetical protein [Anaerolineales bacterium]
MKNILKALAAYRAWRAAQRAYAQAVENEDAKQSATAEEHLHTAYQEYRKYNPEGAE